MYGFIGNTKSSIFVLNADDALVAAKILQAKSELFKDVNSKYMILVFCVQCLWTVATIVFAPNLVKAVFLVANQST